MRNCAKNANNGVGERDSVEDRDGVGERSWLSRDSVWKRIMLEIGKVSEKGVY